MKHDSSPSSAFLAPNTWPHIAWTILVSSGLHLAGIAAGQELFWVGLATFGIISLPIWLISFTATLKQGAPQPTSASVLIAGYALLFGSIVLLTGFPLFPLPLKQATGSQATLTTAFYCLLGGHLLLGTLPIWRTKQHKQPSLLHWFRSKSAKTVGWAILLIGSVLLVLSSNSIQSYYFPPSSLSDIFMIAGLSLQVAIAYGSYYLLYRWHHKLLFQHVLQHQGPIAYLIGGLTSVVLFTALHGALLQLLSGVLTYNLHPVALIGRAFSEPILGFNLLVFVVPLPYIIIVEWFRRERTLTQLEAEKTTTELALLRQQINPHFFFNTLNNLYAMSLSGEERTPETILQLSDLMRYVIYRGKETTVTLREEINYLRDYLELQSLRLAHRLELRFDVDEKLNLDQPVTPMLFVILVENAFKHGIEQASEDAYLAITLKKMEPSGLTFTCVNSIDPEAIIQPVRSTPTHKPRKTQSGLGLVNLRRRLELRYPGQHQLNLSRSNNSYSAVIQLNQTDR